MTEEEAAALADRLTRIWRLSPSELQWIEATGEIGVFGQVTSEVRFCYIWEHGYYKIELPRIQDGRTNGHLFCRVDTGFIGGWLRFLPPASLTGEYALALERAQFADEWLPFFRRNCWLSGCAIEASAHEKAEWVQGFTREELEAWNMKM